MAYKITFNPLWETLSTKQISKTELTKAIGLSKATMAKMGKDEAVSLDVIGRICEELDCKIQDVVAISSKQVTDLREIK